MAELYDILGRIIENDTEETQREDYTEPEDIHEENTENDSDNREEDDYDANYDSVDLNGRVSNSIGRGAVESWIKNSVYEKYSIDSKAMKDFSRLSPTEMLGSFGDSLKELGAIRRDYADGKYSKEEYKALSGKIKGEISGKMLEMGSSRKSILEDILLRSFGVSPADMSKVKTFGDLADLFRDKEQTPDADKEQDADLNPDADITPDTEVPEPDTLRLFTILSAY